MKYIHSYWDSRVVYTSSSTVVTPVNDHAAVAAGHYGAFLGDAPRLPVVFVAAVPPSSPALHHQRCFSGLVDPCRCRQEPSSGHLRCHRRPFLVVTAFFCLATVRSSLGHPRWPLAEQATQPRTLLTQPPCPRLSPPRRCRHPEFSSSLTSSLGSSHPFFLLHCFIATAGRWRPGNLELSLLPPHAAIFWENC